MDLEFIISLIVLIIAIIVLVKFFRLSNDVHIIREVLEDKFSAPEPVVDHRGNGSISPSKSDVREFQDRIKEYKKTHKDIDQEWLENLIEEYNEKFNEDFHQYL